MNIDYELLRVRDVCEQVHNGPTIEELLIELDRNYAGQFVVLSPRMDFFVSNPLRLAEPQADVYGSRKSAKVVAETLDSRATQKGYTLQKISSKFVNCYLVRKSEVEAKLGPVTR